MNETQTQTPLDLAIQISSLKARRNEIAQSIADLEADLVSMLGFQKGEGQESFDYSDERGSLKIVCKQPINTTLDQQKLTQRLNSLRADHPAQRAFSWTYKLDTKAAREVSDEDWRDVADCVTRKPGKIAVEVKDLALKGGI